MALYFPFFPSLFVGPLKKLSFPLYLIAAKQYKSALCFLLPIGSVIEQVDELVPLLRGSVMVQLGVPLPLIPKMELNFHLSAVQKSKSNCSTFARVVSVGPAGS